MKAQSSISILSYAWKPKTDREKSFWSIDWGFDMRSARKYLWRQCRQTSNFHWAISSKSLQKASWLLRAQLRRKERKDIPITPVPATFNPINKLNPLYIYMRLLNQAVSQPYRQDEHSFLFLESWWKLEAQFRYEPLRGDRGLTEAVVFFFIDGLACAPQGDVYIVLVLRNGISALRCLPCAPQGDIYLHTHYLVSTPRSWGRGDVTTRKQDISSTNCGLAHFLAADVSRGF